MKNDTFVSDEEFIALQELLSTTTREVVSMFDGVPPPEYGAPDQYIHAPQFTERQWRLIACALEQLGEDIA